MIFLDIMPSLLNIHLFHPQVILALILLILGQSIHLLQHQVPVFQMDLITTTIGVAHQFQVKFRIHTLSLQWMCIITVGTILLLLLQVTGLVEQSNPWLHPWHSELPGVALISQELECIPSFLVTGQYAGFTVISLKVLSASVCTFWWSVLLNSQWNHTVYSNDNSYWIVTITRSGFFLGIVGDVRFILQNSIAKNGIIAMTR